MNAPSAPPARPAAVSAIGKALDHFLHANKGVIGLSKSEHFNQSVLAIALRDPWIGPALGDLPERLERAGGNTAEVPAKNPALAMYLRGAKQTLAFLLMTLRKSLFSCYGQEMLAFFDELNEKAPSVSSEDFGKSFWPYLTKMIAKRRGAFLESAVMGATVLPCFADLRTTVARSAAPGKDEIESGTVNFVFKRETEIAELLHLLNKEYALPPEDKPPEQDQSVADYADAREHILSHFQNRPTTLAHAKDLVSSIVNADQPKKGESMLEKRKRAAKLFSSVVDLSCEGAGVFDLSLEKKAPNKACPAAQTEFQAINAEVMGYVRGVLAAADAVLVREVRKMAEKLGVLKAYDDTVLAGAFSAHLFGWFLEDTLVTAVVDTTQSRLRRLIQDLRNEGVVKDFNDSSLHVALKGTALIVQISLMLTKHGPYVRKAGALISVSQNLEGELARCASLVEPLIHLLSVWQKKDPAAATKMIGDPLIARRLGEIIHMDYAFKTLMISEPTFLSFLLGNLREEGFLELVGQLATANQKIRRLAVADPRILRTIWLVEKKYPGIGFAGAILSRPMELQSLADSLNEHDGVTTFIKKFLTALRQESPPAAS